MPARHKRAHTVPARVPTRLKNHGKHVHHEFLAYLAELLATLVGIPRGVLIPHLLDGSDLLREALEVFVMMVLVECHRLLAQPFQGQKVLDATIGTPFLVVRQVVLQQNRLLADLPQIEPAVEHRQEVVYLFAGVTGVAGVAGIRVVQRHRCGCRW